MIQGAINQLIGLAAAAKKANDIVQEKETRAAEKVQRETIRAEKEQQRAIELRKKAASKEQEAKERALQRARDKIQARYDQNKEYKEFVQSLGDNQAPDELKRLAFEASKNTPQVTLGGSVIDVSRLSPEAQQVLRGGNK